MINFHNNRDMAAQLAAMEIPRVTGEPNAFAAAHTADGWLEPLGRLTWIGLDPEWGHLFSDHRGQPWAVDLGGETVRRVELEGAPVDVRRLLQDAAGCFWAPVGAEVRRVDLTIVRAP